jgi:hypothetical protein
MMKPHNVGSAGKRFIAFKKPVACFRMLVRIFKLKLHGGNFFLEGESANIMQCRRQHHIFKLCRRQVQRFADGESYDSHPHMVIGQRRTDQIRCSG